MDTAVSRPVSGARGPVRCRSAPAGKPPLSVPAASSDPTVSRVRDDGLAFGVGRPGRSGREEEDLDAAVCGTGGQRVRRPPVTGRDERPVGVVPLGDVGPSRSRSTRGELGREISEEQPERTFRTDTFGYFHTARATGSHLEAGAAIVDKAGRASRTR